MYKVAVNLCNRPVGELHSLWVVLMAGQLFENGIPHEVHRGQSTGFALGKTQYED